MHFTTDYRAKIFNLGSLTKHRTKISRDSTRIHKQLSKFHKNICIITRKHLTDRSEGKADIIKSKSIPI